VDGSAAYMGFDRVISRGSLVGIVTAVSAAVLSCLVAAFSLRWQVHVVDAGARSAIETAVAISALLAAFLLGLMFRQRRRLDHAVLLCALAAVAVTDFTFSTVPALIGKHAVPFNTYVPLVAQVLVPIAFTMAALAKGSQITSRQSRRLLTMGAAGLAVIVIVEALNLILGGHTGSRASNSTATAVINVSEAALFVLAGVVFASRRRPTGVRDGLLAAASFLIAASRLQAVAIPVVAGDWVTPREVLRLIAYGIILVAITREYAKMSRIEAASALRAERVRIARDIHDGLAQDLATIALHGQRLETELGSEHPLTVAARRALAASREAIVDLSASRAPTTTAALREVADELEARHGIQITVRNLVDANAEGETADLEPRAREQTVRVAREAIVNAARHGRARRVEVTLQCHDGVWLLRVSDDGSGIDQSAFASSSGFGLRTMRACAEDLGGQLVAHSAPSGGTVLELSMAAGAGR
jgi:signal transduction histidine kinase